jgi:serine/threonine-protein kinase
MSLEPNQPDITSDQDKSTESNLDLPQQYKVLGKISEGGMGAIYKAQNRYTHATFAIKVIKPQHLNDQEVKQRFIVEAKAASALKHPYICQIHDFGISKSEMPYMVLEWIDGISLGKKVIRDGPLTVRETIQIFEQVAAALAHAHQHRVVHRDLKPDNIMLSQSKDDGRYCVHLVDFGIAKLLAEEGDMLASQGLTQTGVVVGTPLFMSPEQARGKAVDNRSDIYSLGCVMYYALSAKPPFVGDSTVETIHKHMNELPEDFTHRLKIPPGLQMIVLKSMEKNPEDRYQSAEEVVSNLKKLAKGVGIEIGMLSSERERLRQRVKTILFFVVGFAVMFGISIALQDLFPDNKTPHAVQQKPTAK